MRTSGWCSGAALGGSTRRWNGFGVLVGDEGEVTTGGAPHSERPDASSEPLYSLTVIW
jgi:hypothetical protein